MAISLGIYSIFRQTHIRPRHVWHVWHMNHCETSVKAIDFSLFFPCRWSCNGLGPSLLPTGLDSAGPHPVQRKRHNWQQLPGFIIPSEFQQILKCSVIFLFHILTTSTDSTVQTILCEIRCGTQTQPPYQSSGTPCKGCRCIQSCLPPITGTLSMPCTPVLWGGQQAGFGCGGSPGLLPLWKAKKRTSLKQYSAKLCPNRFRPDWRSKSWTDDVNSAKSSISIPLQGFVIATKSDSWIQEAPRQIVVDVYIKCIRVYLYLYIHILYNIYIYIIT